MPALIIPIWISDRLIVMLRVSLIGLAMFAVEAPGSMINGFLRSIRIHSARDLTRAVQQTTGFARTWAFGKSACRGGEVQRAYLEASYYFFETLTTLSAACFKSGFSIANIEATGSIAAISVAPSGAS